MTESQWNTRFTRCFGMRLGGDAILEWDEQGRRVTDDTFLILFNADAEAIEFTLPRASRPILWSVVLDTNNPRVLEGAWTRSAGARLVLEGRSVMVLKRGEA
jgi:glycogen operon protein